MADGLRVGVTVTGTAVAGSIVGATGMAETLMMAVGCSVGFDGGFALGAYEGRARSAPPRPIKYVSILP